MNLNRGLPFVLHATRTGRSEPPTAGAESLDFAILYQVYRRILEPRERRVLELVEVDRMSYGEVAGQLDLTEADVKALVFQARREVYLGMVRTFADLRRATPPRSFDEDLAE